MGQRREWEGGWGEGGFQKFKMFLEDGRVDLKEGSLLKGKGRLKIFLQGKGSEMNITSEGGKEKQAERNVKGKR